MPAPVRPSKPVHRRSLRNLSLALGAAAALLGCDQEPLGTAAELAKAGGPTPLTAAPTSLWLRVGPPTIGATVTARVQYVGLITSRTSDASCATVAPGSVPATKPAGSSVYVATFTVTPVGVGQCTVTLTDKKGVQVTVQVRVRGQRIVFATFRDENLEIYDMNPDGSDQARLTTSSARDDTPVMAHDGSRILFTSDRDGNDEIYSMNPDGSSPVRLTNNAADDRNPAISPDGSRIAFQSDRDGEFQIYSMASDGSDVRRLTSTGIARYPSWSPEGTTIAFSWRAGTGDGDHVFIIAADGSGMTGLTSGSTTADGEPVWSPDGAKIAFTSNRAGSATSNIYVMDADGSDITPLTVNAGVNFNPAWSLDGSRIAFASTRDHPDDNTTQAFDIYTMDASDGGHVARLTSNTVIDWSPGF